MPDIVIRQDKEEEKKTDEGDVKETLRAADEYERLKLINDNLEKEYLRQQELKAKMALGGKALAGEEISKGTSQEDADKEAVDKLVNQFK